MLRHAACSSSSTRWTATMAATTSCGFATSAASPAGVGDLATIDFSVTTSDGTALPEAADVFDQGIIQIEVGCGGLGPVEFLHSRVEGLAVGAEKTEEIPAAEAFGESNPNMGPIDIPAEKAPEGLQAGMMVQLANGAKARVTAVTPSVITIDANHPLA